MPERIATSQLPESSALLGRRMVVIALPVIANNLLTVGMQLTDTVLAGRLSPDALAAVSVGGSVFVPFFLLAMGIIGALSPVSAQLYGAGRVQAIGPRARQAAWIAIALAALLMTGFRFLEPLYRLASVGTGLASVSEAYVSALSWGLPAIFLYLVLRFASEGIGHTRPMLYVALAAFLINIPFDYWFIYGGLGLPSMGAVGAGYATALAMWLQFATMLLYVLLKRRRYGPLELFARFDWPRLAPLAELTRLGFPIGMMLFAEVGLFGAVALMMASFGAITAAAHQIAVSIASLSFMFPLGLATGITVVVGHAAGARRGDLVQRAGRVGIAVSLAFEIVAAILIVVLRYPIAHLFTTDADVITLAAELLLMAAAFQFSDGLQVASAGALRGVTDVRVPMYITIIAYWGTGLPLAWAIGFALGVGPLGIWTGLIAGLTVAGGLLVWRFMRQGDRNAIMGA
jgi:MATE family multidrug resistance protein